MADAGRLQTAPLPQPDLITALEKKNTARPISPAGTLTFRRRRMTRIEPEIRGMH